MKTVILTILTLLSLSFLAWGQDSVRDQKAWEYLQRFQNDPASARVEPILKWKQDNTQVTPQDQRHNAALKLKKNGGQFENDRINRWKEKKLGLKKVGRYAWNVRNDNPNNFFTDKIEDHLANLPVTGDMKNSPWSSDYWALQRGNITARYGDNEYMEFAFNGKYSEIIAFYNQSD
ncbi:MAG: hypothetical protein WCG27_08540, partial [Pseudomonadota bacterium]